MLDPGLAETGKRGKWVDETHQPHLSWGMESAAMLQRIGGIVSSEDFPI